MKEHAGRGSQGETDIHGVYRSALPHIYGYLLALCGGRVAVAEDLTSETFLDATRHAQNGRLSEVTLGWLKTVARRRYVDHVRREVRLTRRVDAFGNEVLRKSRTASEGPDQLAILEALGELSDDHRVALVLHHVDGLTLREISSILDRSEKAVESLLARSRQKFREAYGVDHVL